MLVLDENELGEKYVTGELCLNDKKWSMPPIGNPLPILELKQPILIRYIAIPIMSFISYKSDLHSRVQ